MLICLMLVFTGRTSIAHAAESQAPVTAGALLLHAAGDGDEHPADQHSNLPHHHNVCHGHDVACPIVFSAGPAAADDRADRIFAASQLSDSTASELLPRPPKA